MSNSKRVLQQYLALPLAMAGVASVCWPISFIAAAHTGWISSGTFTDFWMGTLSVVTFIGGTVATFIGVGQGADNLIQWYRD
jgi:hypothetical protein